MGVHSIRRCVKKLVIRRIVNARSPDFSVGLPGLVSLERWRVLSLGFVKLYIHRFLGDDPDDAFHDHPWFSLSWLISGEYIELSPNGRERFCAGRVKFRSSKYRHRILVPSYQPEEVITVFLVGPRTRQWGFWKGENFQPCPEKKADARPEKPTSAGNVWRNGESCVSFWQSFGAR